jgi:hypothetical protein
MIQVYVQDMVHAHRTIHVYVTLVTLEQIVGYHYVTAYHSKVHSYVMDMAIVSQWTLAYVLPDGKVINAQQT